MANYAVTGAGGGMGRALCERLTGQGHAVWGLDRVPPAADAVWRFVQADLTRDEDVASAAKRIGAEAGGLDGIIHMAGIYDLNSLLEMPQEDFLRDFDVNLFGMFRVNQRFLPLLKKGARIVIISSELAPLHALPFTGVYAVTKAAVEKYAQALRMEAQLLGHPVAVIRPGAVKTNMLPASTQKLERFCTETRLYPCNADRFRRIVNGIEARSVPPEKIAKIAQRALSARRPRAVYSVNRNPLLLMLNLLPGRTQRWIIRKVLS